MSRRLVVKQSIVAPRGHGVESLLPSKARPFDKKNRLLPPGHSSDIPSVAMIFFDGLDLVLLEIGQSQIQERK